MSLPPELLKKIKLLEISTRRLVNNLFAGEFKTAFRGQGMTFSEFREYQPGDDVRAISWVVTARYGKPFIKKFEEERELTNLFIVDVSASGDFGTGTYLKGEVMAHLAAILSFASAKTGDAMSLLLVSDRVELYVPPKKGRGQVYRLLRDLYYFKPRSRKTRLKVAFDHALGVLKKKSNVFIFSDFFDKDYEQSLTRLSKKHDVTAVMVTDAVEEKFPSVGLMDLYDPETGEIVTVDTDAPDFHKNLAIKTKQRQADLTKALRRSQVDIIQVDAGKDIVGPLIEYFHRRNRK